MKRGLQLFSDQTIITWGDSVWTRSNNELFGGKIGLFSGKAAAEYLGRGSVGGRLSEIFAIVDLGLKAFYLLSVSESVQGVSEFKVIVGPDSGAQRRYSVTLTTKPPTIGKVSITTREIDLGAKIDGNFAWMFAPIDRNNFGFFVYSNEVLGCYFYINGKEEFRQIRLAGVFASSNVEIFARPQLAFAVENGRPSVLVRDTESDYAFNPAVFRVYFLDDGHNVQLLWQVDAKN
ncbi:hypothetical protein FJZ26_02045 [Candidatus Parvarchaeota archaeon]|nr:hypothetical protein [Candidatus Parvarchaeota archaeon]